MKRHSLTFAAACLFFLAATAAPAAPFTWNKTAAGTYGWDDQANWGGGSGGFPNAADDVANLNVDLAGAQTINLNQVITLGTLNLGDPTTSFFATTVAAGGGSLVMDVSSGSATIWKTALASTATDTISADIQLNDPLLVVNSATSASGILTLSGVISESGGAMSLTKRSTGVLTLGGAGAKTFTGGVVITGGSVALDFASMATPTDLINAANTLTLGGGSLGITGKSTANTSQTLGNVTVNAGGGQILINPNGAARTATLTLGSITATAAGGSLVLGKASAASGTATITTTSGSLTNGIYGGRVVYFNGTANTGFDWATTASGGVPYTVSGFSGYSALPTSGGTGVENYQATAATTFTGNVSANTLKIANTGGAQAIGTNLLTLEGGGILITGSFATISGSAGGTRLTAGAGSNYDLIIHQASSSGSVVSAVIGDNGSNPVSFVKNGAGFVRLGANNTYTGNTYINAGTLNLGEYTPGSNALGRLNPTGTIYNNGVFNISPTGASLVQGTDFGTITGMGSVNISSDPQTVTLDGVNTYTGRTLIQAGVLIVRNFANGGATSSVGSSSSAAQNLQIGDASTRDQVLRYTGGTASTDRLFTIGGSWSLSNNTIEASGSGPLSFTNSGTIAWGASATLITLSGTNRDDNTMTPVIPNNGATATRLVKSGSGKWVLAGANTFTGTTMLRAGTLGITSIGNVNGGSSSLGNPSSVANGTIHIGSGTFTPTLLYTGTGHVTDRVINLAGTTGGGVIDQSGSGLLKFTSAFTGTGAGIKTVTLQGSTAGEGEIAAAIVDNSVTNTTGVTKAGSGKWTLSGVNTFTGPVTVNGGTLAIGGAGQLGGGSYAKAVAIGTGAVFEYASSATQTLSGTITGDGALRQSGSGTLLLAGPNTWSGGAELTGGVLQMENGSALGVGPISFTGGTLKFGAGMAADVSAQLSTGSNQAYRIDTNGQDVTFGTGIASVGGSLTKLGVGTLVLAGNNSYTGVTTISGGTLAVGAGGFTGVLSGNVVNDGGLVFDRFDQSTYAGDISGSGGLTKQGGGRLTLSGSHSYSGVTTIVGGVLNVNGQLSGAAGAVAVQAGAELGGTGMISVNVGGDGRIAPGNSPGILTVMGSVFPTTTTSFAFEFTNTGAPTWSSTTASVNDVLRLTSATPFTTPLVSTNVTGVYFDVTSLTGGDTFDGGFYSDQPSGSLDFAAAIGSPTFQYYVKADGGGTHFYNGTFYYTLAEYIQATPTVSGVAWSVVTVPAANFSGGTVTNGQVSRFAVVPEPAALTLVVAGAGAAIGLLARGRRKSV